MPVRILLADDNPFVRKMIHKLIEGPGREIVEAENGQEAVSLALENRPQVAVLDLAMPQMDGLTAARHIHNQLPELPILMYTMHWSSQLEVEAIKSGIRKVIAKADSASLVAAVQELVDASTQSAASTAQASPLAVPPDPATLPAIEPPPDPIPDTVATESPGPADAVTAVTEDPQEPPA
jgi:CheY-like chemotaxis protein